MTLAVNQASRRRWSGRQGAMTSSGVRATVRPLGVSGVGLLGLLLAAWGGISVFVGPLFGYGPTTSSAWDWTTQNWLLHLVPGACGVFAGLVILGSVPGRRVGRIGGGGVGMAALLMLAAGVWFVIGPAVWPLFESSPAYAHGATANMTFLNQLGANLGPGVLLAAFSGMALKAGIARPKVALHEPTPAPTAPAGEARAAPTDPPQGPPGVTPPA